MNNPPSLDALREAALRYAANGWRVFPCRALGKEPATSHGVKDATTDANQIEAWWSHTPFNVAVATGPESGVFVVDVDPRNGGDWVPSALTYSVATGGGGAHYYFAWPKGVAKTRSLLRPGVDVKGVGGYVIAPPSVTEGPYGVLVRGAPAEAPADLLAAVTIVEGAQPVDQRPGDKFNDEHDWAEILEPHGWTWLYKGRDGLDYWTRPGKDSGISATTGIRDAQGGDPADLIYVFTSSTDFEAMEGKDKFGAYAVLNHGGDIAAAASAIAAEANRWTGSNSLDAVARSSNAAASSLGESRGNPPALATPPYYPALPPEHFVSRYIAYAGSLTDAAPEYHEAAALALLSALTPSVRIDLAFAPSGIRTNLFAVLVGESSKSRKSTAQQIAASLLREIVPDSVLPDRMTGEAAISTLAFRSNRMAMWLPDELGVMVQQIYTRDFLRALEEVLLTLYSGQTYRYLTQADEKVIENVHMVVFGAATPESFAGAGNRAVTSGLLPRFGVVYPAAPPASRPPQASSDAQIAQRKALMETLRALYFRQSEPGGQRKVTFDDLALTVLSSADSVYSKHSMTARLSTAAYKVSALIALVDGRWKVTADDAVAAVTITDRWADGAMRLRSHLARSPQDVAFMESLEMARQELAAIPAVDEIAGRRVLLLRDVARALKVEAAKLRRIQQTLEVTNELIVAEWNGEAAWYLTDWE